MAEYERALFRVYDRTLDSMRNDQPYFYGERFRELRPSVVCRAVEYGLLLFTLTLVGESSWWRWRWRWRWWRPWSWR